MVWSWQFQACMALLFLLAKAGDETAEKRLLFVIGKNAFEENLSHFLMAFVGHLPLKRFTYQKIVQFTLGQNNEIKLTKGEWRLEWEGGHLDQFLTFILQAVWAHNSTLKTVPWGWLGET